MSNLDNIAERIHQSFDIQTRQRDELLAQARTLTRHCANAIRALHRDEASLATEHLEQARLIATAMRQVRANFPELYFAGYTQDALKEFAEASLVQALLKDSALPTPQDLGLEDAAYLQGLAEAAGELRRRALDCLLKQKPQEAIRLLGHMDDIYAVLVTMDYPDAITGGLRRLTDLARGIIERTRGDLTVSLRQDQLEAQMKRLEEQLKES